MTSDTYQFLPFDCKGATPAEYAALNRHTNRMRLERLPDDPPVPLEELIQNLQSIPSFVDLRLWAARTPGQNEITALGNLSLMRTEENPHLASFDISILPEHRRHGLARQMLRRITQAAEADQRRLLMTNTVDRVPSGEAFLLRLGAQKDLVGHTNQLKIESLDRDLVARWLRQGEQNAADIELSLWEGAYPEEHNLFARGNQRWTFYIVDRATGKFAGYTETVWNPNRPEQLRQDMTGVFPQYRGKGLGRWLKAAMLDKVLRDRPQVKFVRTGNADSNAAMLKINHAQGFEPYTADALWQIVLQKVQE